MNKTFHAAQYFRCLPLPSPFLLWAFSRAATPAPPAPAITSSKTVPVGGEVVGISLWDSDAVAFTSAGHSHYGSRSDTSPLSATFRHPGVHGVAIASDLAAAFTTMAARTMSPS